jgi:hypothetical protein
MDAIEKWYRPRRHDGDPEARSYFGSALVIWVTMPFASRILVVANGLAITLRGEA